jgi:hypothetical protein
MTVTAVLEQMPPQLLADLRASSNLGNSIERVFNKGRGFYDQSVNLRSKSNMKKYR